MVVSSAVFADAADHKGDVSKGSNKGLSARTHALEKQVQALQNQINGMHKANDYLEYNLDTLVEMYAHGPAVVTSPALGVRRSAEDASDLMVNLSSINEDLLLLQLRQKMDNYATEKGIPIPERPIIAISGGIEGQLTYNGKQAYTNNKKVDVNLSSVELDIIAEASPWATAAVIITYEDSATKNAVRVKNSRLKVDRAFLTLGQLDKLPLYLTVGQVYSPFGTYSSYMITDPSTKILGRVKDRMVILGYNQNGFYAEAYGLPGETKVVAADRSFFGHTGFNAGYDYAKDNFKIKVGGSVIGNIAESSGMQDNVFAKDMANNSETLNSRVCGVDGRIKVSYEPFTLLAEYVGAVKKFDSKDLSFNNVGAKPQAVNVEAAIEFSIKGKPSNFAVGYGQTWEALALNLPKNTFFAEYDIAILKNTILGVEYRHDINYGKNDQGAGKDTANPVKVDGRHSNSAVAKIAVYF